MVRAIGAFQSAHTIDSAFGSMTLLCLCIQRTVVGASSAQRQFVRTESPVLGLHQPRWTSTHTPTLQQPWQQQWKEVQACPIWREHLDRLPQPLLPPQRVPPPLRCQRKRHQRPWRSPCVESSAVPHECWAFILHCTCRHQWLGHLMT